MVEAQIATKEIELLREYETHQGRPLAANPFRAVRSLLAHDMQAKAQMAHGVREASNFGQIGLARKCCGFQTVGHDYGRSTRAPKGENQGCAASFFH